MDRESENIDFIIEDGVLTGFRLKNGCRYNGYIIVPDGVREIGHGLFRKKWQFRAVRLPEGLMGNSDIPEPDDN